ncbi:MAG: hypothetical protein WCK70_10665 [Chloroflexales bacterium]|jgi:hypothetical protein
MAVIKIERFRLNDGMDEGAFRAVNERFQREVAPTLPGLTRREVTRAPNGEWVLVLRYTDMEIATNTGMKNTSDTARALLSFINMSTLSAVFHEIISE